MSHIQQILKLAQEKNSNEILFHPEHPVRIRIGKKWTDLLPAPGQTVGASRQVIHQILSEDEKKDLFQNFSVSGSKVISAIPFHFNFQINFDGVVGSIELASANKESWCFPQGLGDRWFQGAGLHFVAGPRRSGKSSVIENLLGQHSPSGKIIAVYTDRENQFVNLSVENLSVFPIQQLSRQGVLRGADIVVIDCDSLEFSDLALELCEQGRSVVLSLSVWNVEMALERFLDSCPRERVIQQRRLSRVFQTAIGLQLIAGLEQPLVGAFELIYGAPEVHEMICKGEFDKLQNWMRISSEKFGTRTMNQTLFSLLIKRKIEMKTAFEVSPAPQELDSLLKKVGI